MQRPTPKFLVSFFPANISLKFLFLDLKRMKGCPNAKVEMLDIEREKPELVGQKKCKKRRRK